MLRKRNILILLAVLAAATGVYLGFFYDRITSEERILRELEFARASFEAGRIKQFVSVLAPEYEDPYGMTKSSIHDIARQAYLGARDRRVAVSDPVVELVDARMANVRATVTLTTLSDSGRPAGSSTAPLTFIWRKDDDGWKIVSANGYGALAGAYGVDFDEWPF